MAGEGYFTLPNTHVLATEVENDFLSIADDLKGTDGPFEDIHLGEPQSFGGKYRAWILYRFVSRGQCPHASEGQTLPEVLTAQILVVDRVQGSRGSIERGCREGFALWLAELDKRMDIKSRARAFRLSSTDGGSYDEFRRAMYWDTNQNVLWAHNTLLDIYL